MEQFSAEAVALSGSNRSRFNVADLEDSDHGSGSSAKEEILRLQTKHDAYLARMKLLQDEAIHDGYAASEIDFRQFTQSSPEIRKGNLILMDNGNLRAIWKDGQGTHLGLQFLGGRMVQYVTFKQRKQGQQISRIAGRDSLEEIKRQIDVFELHSLLKE